MSNDLYTAALTRFNALPFPQTRDQHWRFANLKFWSEEIEKYVSLASEKDCSLEKLDDAQSIQFYNTLLGGGKFDALAAASFCSRRLIRIPAGERVKINDSLDSLTNVFILEENSELEILRTRNFEQGRFWIEANSFHLAKNAKLKINTHFLSDDNAPRYSRNDFHLAENAEVLDVFAENGKSHTRAERNVHLNGNGARAEIFALLDAQNDVTHDFRTSQIHSSGGAHSNLKIKNILSDTSRSAFMGLIRVDEDSQKTEAYQSCRSLLLSPTTKASASPVLEIMANDVICSHGCAVARPDKDQLFYMESRGLASRTANRLLVAGFANEVLEKFTDEIFAERVRRSI